MRAAESPERFLDLRRDIAVIQDSPDRILRLDLAGRLLLYSREGVSYQRGFDGRIRRQSRFDRRQETGRNLGWLGPEEETNLWEEIHGLLDKAQVNLAAGHLPLLHSDDISAAGHFLSTVIQRGGEFHDADARKFQALYRDVPILPPDQYRALYLQLTTGCSYNRCGFCTLYRDREYTVRDPKDWKRHLDMVQEFLGAGMNARHGIFLGDANGIGLSDGELIPRLEELRRVFPEGGRFPNLDSLAAFHDTFSDRERTAADYARLRKFRLRRLYIGLETANDNLRQRLRKPGTARQVADRIRVMKESGMAVGVMVLIGIADKSELEAHIVDTGRLLSGLKLGNFDRIFLSVASPATREQGEIELEMIRLRELLPGGPSVIEYDYEGFVY